MEPSITWQQYIILVFEETRMRSIIDCGGRICRSDGLCPRVNLKGIFQDLNLNTKPFLLCDNRSAILMSKSNENSKRSKHIDIKNHLLGHLRFDF